MARSLKPSRFLSKVRRQQQRQREKKRRLHFENLEPRRLLNAKPVAMDDLAYFTDLNTALTVSVVADGVLDNDFDAEGSTLTASKVDDPVNGSVTLNSNGTFTYTPDTDFEGIDTFTYRANDGTDNSLTRTVQVAVGQGLTGMLNQSELASGNLLHSGVLTLTQPLGGGLNLVYRSDTIPAILVPVETMFTDGTTIPDTVTANLTIDGVSSGDIEFDDTGLATGEPLRFVLRSLPTSSSTGMYDWSMDITLDYTTPETYTFEGSLPIVNRASSEFGSGWWLDGLDRLVTDTDGALLVNGDGSTHWFEKDGSTYLGAVGDLTFSTLETITGGYKITDKWGDVREFDSNGYITKITKLNNSSDSFTFTYDGSNRISKITDEFSREYTFTWNGTTGKLDSVNDFFGNDSTLTFSGDELTDITVTDETATGYTAPDWTFGYTTIGGKKYLNSLTDPASEVTTYVYDTDSRRLSQIQNADHTTGTPSEWDLYPMLTEGLATASSGNTVLKVSNIDARYIDELNKEWDFATDHFGNIVSITDPLSATTTFEYDHEGLLFRLTEADPDGAGSATAPVTLMGYDDAGNPVYTEFADGESTTAEYDATLNRITKFTNELGDYETFAYFTDGDLKDWTDFEGNKWSYTYDTHGNLLTETTPDPDGGGSLTAIVTTYEYETTYYNRLKKITYEDNTTEQFTYTTQDLLATATDELGNVTSFTYDPLGRMLTMTLPDPDGAGSQTSPVWTWEYGSNLLVDSETDPLGNETTYTYDEMGRLTKITLPDPDGTPGTLSAPEYEYTYNVAGQLTNETHPQFDNGADITYSYDNAGQMTQMSGPLTGQDTDYTYDLLGRLTEVEDASGRIVNYEYDARSRLTKIIDHDPDGAGSQVGPTTSYAYDDAGQLTSITDPLGRVTAYAYTDNGWLDTKTLPDPDGTGPESAPVHDYDYDTLGRVVTYADPANRETTYDYDDRHRVTKITHPDPDGTGPTNPLQPEETDYTYNNAGWLTEIDAPGDLVTSYTYDNLGRLLTTTLPDPDGAGSKSSPVYSQSYDAMGNILTQTDARSYVTSYSYDNLHRVTTITLPDPDVAGPLSSPVWTYTYNDQMLLDEITDPMSLDTSYGYDDAGRRTTVTDPLSNVTTTTYDLMNRVTKVTQADPDGAGSQTAPETEYTYDIYSRLTEIEDANNDATTFAYDVAGQMIRLDDASGNSTYWTYDELGRQTMETDELGNTRSFYYNSIDRLVRKVDRLGRTTLYGYEGYAETELWYEYSGAAPMVTIDTTTQGTTGTNEVQTVELEDTSDGTFILGFDGQTTAPLDYDATAAEVETALEALANIDSVTVTLSSGVYTITFGGDLAATNVSQLQGAVVQDDIPGTLQRTIEFTYDEAFRMTEADDSTGVANYVYTVDDLGRVTEKEETIGGLSPKVIMTYDYDASGNRTDLAVELAAFMNNADEFENTYTYDALDRLSSVVQDGQSGGNAVALKRVEYVYNASSQVTYINRFETTSGDFPGLRTKFTYDSGGRVDTIQHRDVDSATTSTALNDYTYTYDNINRIIEIDSSEDGVSDYTFDAIGQITDADHDTGRTDESYTYDATGNRTGGDYVVSSKNRTDESTGYEYEYDAEGNRTKRTDTGDNSYEVYIWDHRNRLTDVEFYNSSDVLTKSIEYRYDMFNRMVRRIYDSNGSSSGGVSDTWWAAFDGIHATLEFDGSSASDITHRYLWGQFADDLLSDEQVTSTSSEGDVLWALADQVGTIRDIGEWNSTNSEFEITNHRTYNSFGELESESDSSVDLAFGFTGKWTEEDTGYTHHLNRWFDPEIGKWLSEDPIGFAGGDTNISRYVANRATSLIDTHGLDASALPITTGAGSGQKVVFFDGGEYGVLGIAPPSSKITIGLSNDPYGGEDAYFSVLNPIWFGAWKVDKQFSSDALQAAEPGLVDIIEDGQSKLDTVEDFTQTGLAGTTSNFIDTFVNDGNWYEFAGTAIVELWPTKKKKKDNPDGPSNKNDFAQKSSSGNKADYSDIKDHPSVGPGKDFTQAKKKKILEANKEQNGGVLKSDASGTPLVPPKKHTSGVTPPSNEAHVDHIVAKSKGGTNGSANAQVLSREENLRKSNK